MTGAPLVAATRSMKGYQRGSIYSSWRAAVPETGTGV